MKKPKPKSTKSKVTRVEKFTAWMMYADIGGIDQGPHLLYKTEKAARWQASQNWQWDGQNWHVEKVTIIRTRKGKQ